ncbi:hypothetical protein ABZ567_04310 [Streptomyces sp. NPDC016459]|uniref:hypothetical protein n=1 Tax=Streptomyces sp. NPDC016459 TaxID=3157190 RepID=UPI0033D59E97
MSHSGTTLILAMSIAVLAALLAYAVGRRLWESGAGAGGTDGPGGSVSGSESW